MRKTRGGTVLALSPNVCLRQNLIRPWGNCQIAGRIPGLRVRRPKGLLAGPVALETQKGFGKSDRKGDPVGTPLAGAQNDTAGAPDETAVLGFTTAAV